MKRGARLLLFVSLAALCSPAFAQAGVGGSGGAPSPDDRSAQPGSDTRTSATAQQTAATPSAVSASRAAPAAEQGAGQLGDIIVTARRTNEVLQRTPVAVSAFTPAELTRAQITSVNDLQRVTPGLSAGGVSSNTSQAVYLSIRGQSQNTASQSTDSSVGIYVDGVYYARQVIGNSGFIDLASAEVLRGPQGTLFGRNTTGGALNVTTMRPKDVFEGYVEAGVGDYGARLAEGVVNVPLTSELASRSAFHYETRDGYAQNVTLGRDIGGIKHDLFARESLLWTPAALPLKLSIVADYANYRDNGLANAIVAINPTGPLAGIFNAAGIDPNQYLNNKNHFYRVYGASQTGDPEVDKQYGVTQQGGVAANLDVDLSSVHVKSITGYRKSNLQNSVPLDGTPGSGAYADSPAAPFLPPNILAFVSQYRQQQISEELQVSGKAGKLDWIAGAIYFHEFGTFRSDSYVFTSTVAHHFDHFGATSTGAFAQATYHVNDKLRITGGIRYTWDRRTLLISDYVDAVQQICSQGPGVGVPGGDCREHDKANYSYPAWLASIDYQAAPNIFLYAKTSGASLSGGFNVFGVPVGKRAFQPEHVKDVEVGFKGDFLNHHLRTNVSAFYIRRNGAQSNINAYDQATQSLSQYVTNDGNVLSKGVEFEGTVLPWHGMELTTAASYLSSHYEKGTFLVPGVLGPVDHDGERVQRAPKWTVSVGGTQSADLSRNAKATFHLDYSYISSQAEYQDTPDPNNPTQNPVDYAIQNKLGIIPGYGLVNGRVAVDFASPKLEVAAWVRNLTNKHYFTGLFDSYTGTGDVVYSLGMPRMYGVTATYRW